MHFFVFLICLNVSQHHFTLFGCTSSSSSFSSLVDVFATNFVFTFACHHRHHDHHHQLCLKNNLRFGLLFILFFSHSLSKSPELFWTHITLWPIIFFCVCVCVHCIPRSTLFLTFFYLSSSGGKVKERFFIPFLLRKFLHFYFVLIFFFFLFFLFYTLSSPWSCLSPQFAFICFRRLVHRVLFDSKWFLCVSISFLTWP